MLLLLLLLLFAPLGHAGISSEVDCEKNLCFVMVNCTTAKGDQKTSVYDPMEAGNEDCPASKPRQLQMLVEIDARSARRFDFRVFYRAPSTVLYFPKLVSISSGGVQVFNKWHPITDSSPPRGGNGVTANCSSYRFTMENLFRLFASIDTFNSKASFQEKSVERNNPSLIAKFTKNSRCDPSDLVDHCAAAAAIGDGCEELHLTPKGMGTCSRRLWFQNAQNDTWLWVNEIVCDQGDWKVIRDGVKSDFTAGRMFCGETPPVCEFATGKLVLMILLGIYCTIATIIIVALFVILSLKMDELTGPCKFKIIRVRGTMEQKPTSESASENEPDGVSSNKSNARNRKSNKVNEQSDPSTVKLIPDEAEVEPSVSKIKQPEDSGSSGETDVDRLKTEIKNPPP